MLFSSKISNSVITYLENRGVEIDQAIDLIGIPEEFLRDPSAWVPAQKMETLLQYLEAAAFRKFENNVDPQDLNSGWIEKAASESIELRTFGVLDSVLRMVGHIEDYYSAPDRLLSYFVSPPPPIANLKKTQAAVTFELPISIEEFPSVIRFMVRTLEVLPGYLGGTPSQVKWSQHSVQIDLNSHQIAMLQPASANELVNPTMIRDLIQNLEITQKQLEARNRELHIKDEELRLLKGETAISKTSALLDIREYEQICRSLFGLSNKLARIHDYFARAQQLVTLSSSDEVSRSMIAKAMKKLDWLGVQAEFSSIIQQARTEIHTIRKDLEELNSAKAIHQKQSSLKARSTLIDLQ
ncbi:MAG: hypothetical protein COT74_06790 [Bdellovibrionales bacterium CG10_big_fil_rev_8_21_14_0_10_45_34]|nr:MAG: hypothetical protein COT74_06790 [Bdellovibrionales bacterium CG10_big_fil_rev_8_21_14_0_10_45_34]